MVYSLLSSDHYIDEKVFYDSVRQYIISLLTFITLYFASYLIIFKYKKKINEESDDDDALVYKIAIWLCCFTMTVSIGAVLLLPFSIFSNEILLSYPDSYYLIWINDSLIHSLWNQIFLGTYIAIFFAMPFAYFFTESEGFAGSQKGIKSRVYETFIVLLLLLVLVSTLIWVFSAFMVTNQFNWFSTTQESWTPPLPFIYSCMSLFGVLLLLICTPLGFARLFSVLGDYIVRPKFFVDLDVQINSLNYEEENLKKRLKRDCNYRTVGLCYTEQQTPGDLDLHLENLKVEITKLKRQQAASGFEKNLLFPLCLLGLLAVTIICFFLVAMNCFKLLFGSDPLPFMHKYPSLGKISISRLGWLGIFLQVFLIFYIMTASIVGLYTSPLFSHLTPKKDDTSLTVMIANSIILLVLSSALPVLVRILGITSFDLMGEFGRLNWLGNYKLVLFYNLLFEAATSFCLVSKFTKSLRKALYEQFKETKFISSIKWKMS